MLNLDSAPTQKPTAVLGRWKAKLLTLVVVATVVALVGHNASRNQISINARLERQSRVAGEGQEMGISHTFEKMNLARRDLTSQVCIPARSSYGSYVVKQSGIISSITLTHKSGEMLFCGMGSAWNCRGKWGGSWAALGFNVFVVRNDGVSVIYPTGGVAGYQQTAYGYHIHGGAAVNAPTFKMVLGSQFSVTVGEVLRFYSMEGFKGLNWGDNFGQTCADVTLGYRETTTTTTTKKPTNSPVTKKPTNAPTTPSAPALPLCGKLGTQTACQGAQTCLWDSVILKCRCKGGASKDFVFVVDMGGSISAQDWLIQKKIVEDMVVTMVPVQSSVGIIQFNSQVTPTLSLFPRGKSISSVMSTIRGMTQSGGGSYIGTAMQAALKSSAYFGNGAAQPGWVVLVTTGKNSGGRDPCSLTVQPGVNVLIIGVTMQFNQTTADCLTQTAQTGLVLTMDYYDTSVFQLIAPDINNAICAI